jgi:hypothetical protein
VQFGSRLENSGAEGETYEVGLYVCTTFPS